MAWHSESRREGEFGFFELADVDVVRQPPACGACGILKEAFLLRCGGSQNELAVPTLAADLAIERSPCRNRR